MRNVVKKTIATVIICTSATYSVIALADGNEGNGGVGLGATRLVYHADDKQISLNIRNTSGKTQFLIQSMIMDETRKKSPDFVVTPPLFLLNTEKENVIRIMHVGPDLPTDRESLFYVSARAIPSTEKNEHKSSLKVAVQSVIKLFWRPNNLSMAISDAPANLHCIYSGNAVTVENPTPYYITLTKVNINGQSLKNEMIAPKSQHVFNVKKSVTGTLRYQTINDFGAITPELTCRS